MGTRFDGVGREYTRYSSVSVKVRIWHLNLNDSWADEGPCLFKRDVTVNCSTVDALHLKRQSVIKGNGMGMTSTEEIGRQTGRTTETTPHSGLQMRSEFVMSTENARDSGQSSTNTSNTQQHSQQLSSRVAGIIHFNS